MLQRLRLVWERLLRMPARMPVWFSAVRQRLLPFLVVVKSSS